MKNTGKTILIGDGDEIARKRLFEALTAQGNTVYTAANGTQATDMISVMNGKIDMLVIDLAIPPVNGYWVLSWIREKAYDGMFPVTALCGTAELNHVVDELRSKGASLVMARDSKIDDILYQINQELGRSKLDRAAPRVAVSLPAEAVGGSGSASGHALNLSRTGAFLQTGVQYRAGEELSIKLTLAGSIGTIQATAVVRRMAGVKTQAGDAQGVGVEFTFLSDKARNALKAFLKTKQEKLDLKGHSPQEP